MSHQFLEFAQSNFSVVYTAGPWLMRFFRLGKIRIFQIRITEIQVSRYVICLNLAYADFHQSPSLLRKISMRKLKAETIDKALQQIREACDVLESDSNIEQFLVFKQHILAGTSIYKNCLMEKAKKKKQQKLLEFYETE